MTKSIWRYAFVILVGCSELPSNSNSSVATHEFSPRGVKPAKVSTTPTIPKRLAELELLKKRKMDAESDVLKRQRENGEGERERLRAEQKKIRDEYKTQSEALGRSIAEQAFSIIRRAKTPTDEQYFRESNDFLIKHRLTPKDLKLKHKTLVEDTLRKQPNPVPYFASEYLRHNYTFWELPTDPPMIDYVMGLVVTIYKDDSVHYSPALPRMAAWVARNGTNSQQSTLRKRALDNWPAKGDNSAAHDAMMLHAARGHFGELDNTEREQLLATAQVSWKTHLYAVFELYSHLEMKPKHFDSLADQAFALLNRTPNALVRKTSKAWAKNALKECDSGTRFDTAACELIRRRMTKSDRKHWCGTGLGRERQREREALEADSARMASL